MIKLKKKFVSYFPRLLLAGVSFIYTIYNYVFCVLYRPFVVSKNTIYRLHPTKPRTSKMGVRARETRSFYLS